MTHPDNPFGEFEDDFKNTEKAEPGATPGRVPEETYKFVLTSVDLKEDGVLVDNEVIVANTGTKGFKLFCEILEPESVLNAKTGEPHITKGAILDRVWWITKKTLPYVKRDLSTILGRDIGSLIEATSITWAGRTFEGVVQDDKRDGIVRSRIEHINPWAPPAEPGPNPHGAATSSPAKGADPKGGPAKSTAAAKPSGPAKTAAGPAKQATQSAAKPGGANSDF